MPEELRMYSDTATWNIEAFHVKEVVDPEFVETAATRSAIQEYADEKDYCGMTVFFDNIKKEIFVWVVAYAKHKGWVKKLVGMHGDKFDIQFREIFQKIAKKNIRDYTVTRIDEGQETEKFEWIFMYEIAELAVYTQHHPKAEYQEMFDRLEEEKAIKESSVKKCEKCGWILTAGKTVCPRCGYNPEKGKGGKESKGKVPKMPPAAATKPATPPQTQNFEDFDEEG